MELNRRNFIKGSLAAGTLAALGGLAGCASPKSSEKDTAKASAEKKIPATFTDGKWIGRAMGHRDYLTVEIIVKAGALASVKLVRNDDTIGVGSVAGPMMVKRIFESGNLDVDAVSGATMTSYAVRSAIEDAITNAGGKPDDFKKGTVAPTGGTAHTEEVDAVFMGAGTAGLIGAVRLLEAGKKVIVFEKQDIPGGSMAMTYSGIIAPGSDIQKNYSLGRFDNTNDMNYDKYIALVKTMTRPEFDRFGTTIPYQTNLYQNSPKLVNWMHEIGVGFMTMGTSYGTTAFLAPGSYMGGSGYAVSFMADRIVALGGKLVYATKVTELIQEANGTVTGVKAVGKDGSTWTVKAKAVCLTSGGFANNKEMLKQHYPDYADFNFNCAPGSTGDGIILGQKAGAAIECMGRELGAFNSTTPKGGSRFEVAFLNSFAPGIMVNSNGDEFGKGNLSHAALGKAIRDTNNGGRFFHITDKEGSITLEKNDKWASDDYRCLFSRGDVVHYNTVEEAAEALKLPNLRATFNTHNDLALAGAEDAFARKNLPYLNENEGIWVIECMPTFYLTTGGITIDTRGHVIKESGSVIPGLYAAGDVAGSIEEKDGNKYGYGFDCAMTYGFIMAETVSKEI